MLVTKKEGNGIIEAWYESSNIVYSRYTLATNDLDIVFKHGVEYTYKKVPFVDYTVFEMAESQGKILNTRIKSFEAVKGDKVDVELLLEEIHSAKQGEVTKMMHELIQSADALRESMESGSNNANLLLRLKDMKNLTDLIIEAIPNENE
jgi:hypothetical protein